MRAVRRASAAAIFPASTPVGESDGASSEGAGGADEIVSAAQAPSSAQAPPRSEVSAAVTHTTRSASRSAPWMRAAAAPSSSSGSRSGLDASWTTTAPLKSRACVGRRTASSSRRPARRSRPPAITIVCRSAGIPSRSSSSMTAATASWRGSAVAPGRGRERGSIDDRDAAATGDEIGETRARQRVAERLADGSGDVAQRIEGRGRREQNGVVGDGDERDA